MKIEQGIPKRRYLKLTPGITQKKLYNIQNTAKVWNQEYISCLYAEIYPYMT
jgi:hypothetical protein